MLYFYKFDIRFYKAFSNWPPQGKPIRCWHLCRRRFHAILATMEEGLPRRGHVENELKFTTSATANNRVFLPDVCFRSERLTYPHLRWLPQVCQTSGLDQKVATATQGVCVRWAVAVHSDPLSPRKSENYWGQI